MSLVEVILEAIMQISSKLSAFLGIEYAAMATMIPSKTYLTMRETNSLTLTTWFSASKISRTHSKNSAIACPIRIDTTNRTTKPINITTKLTTKQPLEHPGKALLFPIDSLSRWIANCIGDGSDMVCFLDWGEY